MSTLAFLSCLLRFFFLRIIMYQLAQNSAPMHNARLLSFTIYLHHTCMVQYLSESRAHTQNFKKPPEFHLKAISNLLSLPEYQNTPCSEILRSSRDPTSQETHGEIHIGPLDSLDLSAQSDPSEPSTFVRTTMWSLVILEPGFILSYSL